jgi:hypothetical protein
MPASASRRCLIAGYERRMAQGMLLVKPKTGGRAGLVPVWVRRCPRPPYLLIARSTATTGAWASPHHHARAPGSDQSFGSPLRGVHGTASRPFGGPTEVPSHAREVLPQRGSGVRLRPRLAPARQGSKKVIMVPSHGPLETACLQGKGLRDPGPRPLGAAMVLSALLFAHLTAKYCRNGHGLRPPSRRRKPRAGAGQRGSAIAIVVTVVVPSKVPICRGKCRGSGGPCPLGAAMDSTAFFSSGCEKYCRNGGTAATTGAWPSPTISALAGLGAAMNSSASAAPP